MRLFDGYLIEREDMNLKDCMHIIKNCTMLACEYHIKDKCNYGYEVRENRFECAKEQAIKALEKQIPKKPYIQQVEIDYYEHDCMECPSCDSFLGYASECKEEHYKCNYCPNCGQKLDW